jgi:hypothetical protein
MAAEKRSPGSLVDYVDSDYNESDIESPKSPTPKRPKVQWQETLIALIAAQQYQLSNQLSRQSNTLARYRFPTTAAPPRGGIAQLSVNVFKIPPVLICNITHKNTGIFEIFAFKCTINHANNNLRLSVD